MPAFLQTSARFYFASVTFGACCLCRTGLPYAYYTCRWCTLSAAGRRWVRRGRGWHDLYAFSFAFHCSLPLPITLLRQPPSWRYYLHAFSYSLPRRLRVLRRDGRAFVLALAPLPAASLLALIFARACTARQVLLRIFSRRLAGGILCRMHSRWRSVLARASH